MNKDEALNLIKQVAGQFRGTLEEHNSIQQAIRTVEMELTRAKAEAEKLVADAEHPANAPEPE